MSSGHPAELLIPPGEDQVHARTPSANTEVTLKANVLQPRVRC